jgi:hypothetical protein
VVGYDKYYLERRAGRFFPVLGFDVDYQAILNYAITQGYTLPSLSQQLLQNQLVVDLKDAGVWSKLDTFGVFATDGSSDFALIDYKRLSQYTAVNSPTFTINEGFKGNGTSAYINSNYNPTTNGINFTTNDASLGFWEFSTTAGLNSVNMGSDSNLIVLQQKFNGAQGFLRVNDTTNLVRPSLENYTAGFVIGQRINSTQTEYFTPAQLKISSSPSSVSLDNDTQTTLKQSTRYSDSLVSIQFFGSSFSSSEISDFYNAVNSYITSL